MKCMYVKDCLNSVAEYCKGFPHKKTVLGSLNIDFKYKKVAHKSLLQFQKIILFMLGVPFFLKATQLSQKYAT